MFGIPIKVGLTIICSVLVLFPSSSHSSEINLPRSYYCESDVSGGLFKNKSGKWQVSSFDDPVSFTIDVRKFNVGTKEEIEQCNVAIVASGKRDDEYSKSKRDTGSDVCIIQKYRNASWSPIAPEIRYCSLLDDVIECNEFSFHLKFLEFFDFDPNTQGYFSNAVRLIHGVCKSQ